MKGSLQNQEEELFSRPKFGHRLVQEHRDGRLEGEQIDEAKILIRQLQRRFGILPEWVLEKIATTKKIK